jgi:hypothetical protein
MFHEPSLFEGGDDGTFVPFTDMLLNVLMGFSIMVFVSFALIRPDALTGNVNVQADYLINLTWPDSNPDDMDLYVEDPAGNIAWYRSLEAGFLSLERDDRGLFHDTIVVNGKKIENQLNQETVTLRGIIPGEYIVNVNHYVANGIEPVPVTVTVQRVNPRLEVVFHGTVTVDHRGDEKTVVRFTLDSEGNYSNLNDRFVSLTRAVGGGNKG